MKRCEAAAARRPATRSSLRAPIAGRIVEVLATLGASYDEGAPLFRIVRTDRVELQAQVPAADARDGPRRRRAGVRDSRSSRSAAAASPTTCTTPA